jgi:hypothetical protein
MRKLRIAPRKGPPFAFAAPRSEDSLVVPEEKRNFRHQFHQLGSGSWNRFVSMLYSPRKPKHLLIDGSGQVG